MQDGVVVLVVNRRQYLALDGTRRVEQGQGGIGMAGEHDAIEVILAGRRADRDCRRFTPNPFDRFTEPDFDRTGSPSPIVDQCVDVARRATDHDPPGRTLAEIEHLVLGHEANQIARRKIADPFGR